MKAIQFVKAYFLLCTVFLVSCGDESPVTAKPDEIKQVKITELLPQSGYHGETIIITGENFLKNKEANFVWFSSSVQAIVDSATSSRLYVKVPLNAQTGKIIVSNGTYSDTSTTTFRVLENSLDIEIKDFTPKSAYPDSTVEVTISGQNFGYEKNDFKVFFGSAEAIVKGAYQTLLKVQLPAGADSGPIRILFKGKEYFTIDSFLILERATPVITSIEPATGYKGTTTVIITGSNFGNPEDTVTIQIGKAIFTMQVNSSMSVQRIEFKLPIDATSSEICITTKYGKKTCSKEKFIVNEGFLYGKISFSGIKYAQSREELSRSEKEFTHDFYQDTIILKNVIEISRCAIPTKISSGPCGWGGKSFPFKEEALQCFHNNNYEACDVAIDESNNLFKEIIIVQHYYNDPECRLLSIKLQNVPFVKSGNVYSVRLIGNEIKKYLKEYTFHRSVMAMNSSTGLGWETYENGLDVVEILPDAFFEISLE